MGRPYFHFGAEKYIPFPGCGSIAGSPDTRAVTVQGLSGTPGSDVFQLSLPRGAAELRPQLQLQVTKHSSCQQPREGLPWDPLLPAPPPLATPPNRSYLHLSKRKQSTP